MFLFGERAFSLQRQIGSPYYFDIVVAPSPAGPGPRAAAHPGIFDTLLATVRQWRPASIFPNIVQADEVEIGIRATLVVAGGTATQDAIRARSSDALHASVDDCRLGRGVLYSDVMLLARTVPGVVDVQNLHLRRYPPVFAEIKFAGALFGQSVELEVGENAALAPDEIAQFTIDSDLIDIRTAP